MIQRRIIAAVALLCAFVVPAHAQKTKAELNTEITTSFPNNTVGAITPTVLRGVTSDIVNSIMPTAPVVSGNLSCFNGTTGLLQDCGLAPSIYLTRQKLFAARSYYVRSQSLTADTNCSGLVNVDDPGVGTIPRACAFATPQKASDTILYTLDLNGQTVTTELTGSFTTGVACAGTFVGGGSVVFTSTDGATVTTTNANGFTASYGCKFTINGGITLSTVSSGLCLLAGPGGYISMSGLTFGAVAASGSHIQAGYNAPSGFAAGGGTIDITGNYTITGGGGAHIHAATEGSLIHYSLDGMTVTLTGTPAFANFFAGVTKGLIYAFAVNWNGPATGLKYVVHNGGTVTGPARATLPGDVAGVVASGGSYSPTDSISNLGVAYAVATVAPARSTPAAGYADWYTDSTTKRFNDKDDAGTIGTTVVPDTGAANQFLTAINAAGVVSKAQPSFTNISGSVAASQMPALTGDVTTSAGTVATTLATVTANVGTFGSATSCVTVTNNAKGLTTAISAATCTPAIGSISGLGTGVATALGNSVSTVGAFVVNGGSLGTPSGGNASNLTALPLTTGVTGTLPVANGGTGVTTAAAEQARLSLGMMVAAATAVNFNSANTDTAITISLPTGYTRFSVLRAQLFHASASLTTSTVGLYTTTGAGGFAIITAATPVTVSTAADATTNNGQAIGPAGGLPTTIVAASLATPNTIYFRVQTPQGSAATGDIAVLYYALP